MLRKALVALGGSLLLSACAATSQTVDVSPAQSYRPAGSDQLWRITGDLNNTFEVGFSSTRVTRQLTVYVNGEVAIQGNLSARATGELSGSYEGHQLVSSCSSEQKTPNWIDVRCMILIDNERAATLTF